MEEKEKLLVKVDFENWLDASVLSNLIIEELEENELPVNFNMLKQIWLDLLEEIPDMIRAGFYWRLKK